MEIGNGNGKDFRKAKRHLLAFINENNGKWEKRKVKGHKLHVRRKMCWKFDETLEERDTQQLATVILSGIPATSSAQIEETI